MRRVKRGFSISAVAVYAAALFFLPLLHSHDSEAGGFASPPVPSRESDSGRDLPYGGHAPDGCPACQFAATAAIAAAPAPVIPPPERLSIPLPLPPVRLPAHRAAVRLPPSRAPPAFS